jgi:plasmid stabilization system protein ParE
MIERVIYTEEAEDDVAESYDWYENCAPGLGEDFLRCVEACVLTIQRHPHLYPVAVDDFRRALGVPKDYGIYALVPMGYPLGRFGPVRRRPVDEVLHWEQW